MTGDAELDEAKRAMRRVMRANRAAAARGNPGAAQALAALWPAAMSGQGVVAGYWPMGDEMDARPLMTRLERAGARLALPHVPAPNTAPTFRAWSVGAPIMQDYVGAPGAAPEAASLRPTIILAPLIAFDRAGGRLGRGGGHYDRAIAQWRPFGAIAVGLAFAAQEAAAVPMGAHDQRLAWILTEAEAIRVSPSA